MIGFVDSFLPWTAATLVPAFLGTLIPLLAGNRLKTKYLVALAFGIFLWFFVDTIRDSASLDVVDAFSASTVQIVTVGLFVAGVLAFFWFDRDRNVFSPMLAVGKYRMTIPLLVAISLGIHGLGEGAAFSALASQISSTNLLDAFAGPAGGGVNSVVAYLLHKAFEPMIIGACYCAYSRHIGESVAARLKDAFLMSIVFVTPALAGAAIGYYVSYNIIYLFALGTGASIYAGLRLVGPVFDNAQHVNSQESVRMALMIIVGLLMLYFATLFHSG